MKGIILAGGTGTRLHPITKVVSKQLLPVYDKPMIYYPLSTLLLAGIRDVLIITTPQDSRLFQDLLGNGNQWGISLNYEVQPKPEGLAQAFIIGEKFIGKDSCCLILGDNIFYAHNLVDMLQRCAKLEHGAAIFGYYVKDPERYGVVCFDKQNKVTSIEEKPLKPKSHYAIPGLYFFDNSVINLAKGLKPSARKELEITDIINNFLNKGQLRVEILGRGTAWLDTGTFESLLQANNFVSALEDRQGLKISCPEEIAWRMGYINEQKLRELAEKMSKNGYGQYLLELLAMETANF